MLIAALALSLLSQDPQVVDGIIVRGDWAQTPNAEQLTPPTGTEWSSGSAQLLCTVLEDGTLARCVVESITPEGPRVRAYALELASHFRQRARLWDGRPVTGLKVRFTVRWSPED